MPADSVLAYRRPLSSKPPDGSSARGPVQSALPGCHRPVMQPGLVGLEYTIVAVTCFFS